MNTTAYGLSPAQRRINLALMLVFLLLLAAPLAAPAWGTGLGIASRLLLAALCLLNGVWMVRLGQTVGGALVLLVGIGALVTALLGYGANGTPPVPWLFP